MQSSAGYLTQNYPSAISEPRFSAELPPRGKGGLYLHLRMISRGGREVPRTIEWRALMGGVNHEKKWGRHVGKRLTKGVIYRAKLYPAIERVRWYEKEAAKLRRERKRLVSIWDRYRKMVQPLMKS